MRRALQCNSEPRDTLIGRGKLLVLMLVAGLVIPTLSLAQALEENDLHRRNNCRLAEQVIRTGHPANKMQWAWQYIGLCPAAQQIPLLLDRIQQARQSPDSALAHDAMLRLSTLQDGTLFRAVLNVAGDRQSTVTARIHAFMALAAVSDPTSYPRYEAFVQMGQLPEGSVGVCTVMRSHHLFREPGPTPLPADYRSQIVALARRVAADPTEAREVRGAARCLT
ncbi:MAG TPA: hypothetical protein VF665_20645 [Longimicrobium sp.]|jgi:hypothetical protein|uniref:hypothetical protein n=1 Tax=Longimicrobium sp. TaxID=2029185 RepID=UPI002ED8AEA6